MNGIYMTTIGCLVMLLAEHNDRRWLRTIGKCVASWGFFLTGVMHADRTADYGVLLLLALGLDLAGDLLLLVRGARWTFLGGLILFLSGHVVRCGLFMERGTSLVAAVVAALVVVGPAVVVGRWLLPKAPKPMRVPVGAYMVVITLMVALGIGSAVATATWPIVLGVLLFWCSDISVAMDRFIGHRFVNKLWGLPFYYGAQSILAYFAGDR